MSNNNFDHYSFSLNRLYRETAEWTEEKEGLSPVMSYLFNHDSEEMENALERYEELTESEGLKVEYDEEVDEHFNKVLNEILE